MSVPACDAATTVSKAFAKSIASIRRSGYRPFPASPSSETPEGALKRP